MGRSAELARFVTREGRGIEIGPWCNPVAPKRSGYNCRILDVFDTATLRQRAGVDPGIPESAIAGIEEVDFVGSSTCIADLVGASDTMGTFDYIVSSHNFEHLPDPLKFLQGCEKVLRPGGVLSMAIPDRRCCFDYFRPHSSLAELLAAFFEQRERPTQAQIFERWSLQARRVMNGEEAISFPLAEDMSSILPFDSLHTAFAMWQDFVGNPDELYRDTHCWVFTPASCELILADLRFLGLIAFEIVDVTATSGNEFYVHLQKASGLANDWGRQDQAQFYTDRRDLIRRAYSEASFPPATGKQLQQTIAEQWRRIAELEGRVSLMDPLLHNGTVATPVRVLMRMVYRLFRHLT
ncbi:MAG: methyltransferase domain-containing protein [Deltaproteobacteria bacterium]|nr:methyltransferase domain-containing protein [Deltaproteobacteria bacterium]